MSCRCIKEPKTLEFLVQSVQMLLPSVKHVSEVSIINTEGSRKRGHGFNLCLPLHVTGLQHKVSSALCFQGPLAEVCNPFSIQNRQMSTLLSNVNKTRNLKQVAGQ